MIRTFSQNETVRISDGSPTRSRSLINVTGMGGHVRKVTCSVRLRHENLADLRLMLVSPDGRELVLSHRRGGNLDGELDLTFDDSATYPVGVGKSGPVRPEWPLAGMAGVSADGQWQLLVDDLVPRDGGTLLGWALTLDTETASEFNIELEFQDMPSAYAAAFEAGRDTWQSAIVGDIPSVEINGRLVDDLLIFAAALEIDGPGGVLGQAGPNYVRMATNLPITGVMQFDIADLAVMHADGSLVDVIVHEMGHVLGIGTLWEHLVRGLDTDDPVFIGPNAMREYGALISQEPTPVPVENTGGRGTRGGHWRESVFDHELMTGWLDRGQNPMSRITLGALADLGYAVNIDAADDYQFLTGFRRPRTGPRRDCTVRPPKKIVI